MKHLSHTLVLLLLCGGCLLFADEPKPAATGPYANDFEKVEVGKSPEDVMATGTKCVVREAGGNRYLELPGDPLENKGVLFGPEGQAPINVSARIMGTSAGRLFPEFGVGAYDRGGYKLWLMPGVQKIELRKGEQGENESPETKAQADYKGWESGKWTRFRLRVTEAGGKHHVEGKVWPDGTKEPEQWTITVDDETPLEAGRASVWANPYSGTPVGVDDLRAAPVQGK